MLRGWVVGLVGVGLLCGCSSASEFVCTGSSGCVLEGVQGWCEPSGFCSFPDEECPSGRRYGVASGDGLAGTCVEPDDSTGTTRADGPGSSSGSDTSLDASSSSVTVSESSTHAASSSESTACPPTPWFPDGDGDGFGADEAIEACDPPAGHVDRGGDCDDADPRVYPEGLGCPGPQSLAGWWRLDEQNSGFFDDSSANGHHGVVSLMSFAGEVVEGVYGGAVAIEPLTFADRIDISAALSTIAPEGAYPTEGTMEAWVRPGLLECVGSFCSPIIVHMGNPGDGFGAGAETHLHIMYDEMADEYRWGFFTGDGGGRCQLLDPTPVSLPGEWTHLAGTWTANACELYVDGTRVSATLFEGPTPKVTDYTTGHIGGPAVNNGFIRQFPGTIDEVMVFDVPRTEAEIRSDCGMLQCER